MLSLVLCCQEFLNCFFVANVFAPTQERTILCCESHMAGIGMLRRRARKDLQTIYLDKSTTLITQGSVKAHGAIKALSLKSGLCLSCQRPDLVRRCQLSL